MEFATGLYNILILFSAALILLGIVLNVSGGKSIPKVIVMCLILAIVIFFSMSLYLFTRVSTDLQAGIGRIFAESLIMVMNMIVARFIYKQQKSGDVFFEKNVKQLFFTTFISEIIILILIFYFGEKGHVFPRGLSFSNPVFLFSLLLMMYGSVIPGAGAVLKLFKRDGQYRSVNILLLLNMINNVAGLLLYTLRIPDAETSYVFNMVANLVFSYYYGFMMLSVFFEKKKIEKEHAKNVTNIYRWEDFKNHLHHWHEAKAYMEVYDAELAERIDQMPLTDLEKIHWMLRELNVKPKDVAVVMNVSIRAVEMQRYRINKKIG